MPSSVRLAGGLAILSLVGCGGGPTLEQPSITVAQVHEARAALETQELAQPIARDRTAQRELLERAWTRVQPSIHRVCAALQPIGCKRIVRQMRPVWVEDASINAYADDATWQIGMHAGLLARAGSEDEIAFTLAHEAAHLYFHHGARKRDTAMDSLFVGALAGFALAYSTRMTPEATGRVGRAMAENAYVEGYTRYSPQMELEADQFAAYVIADAGYDIRAAAQLAVRLYRSDPQGNAGAGGYLQTHPDYGLRLAALHLTQERVARGQTAPRFNNEGVPASLAFEEVTTHAYVPRLKAHCRAQWQARHPRCEWWKGKPAGFMWTIRCPSPYEGDFEQWKECLE